MLTDSAVVTITMTPANDPPVPMNDFYRTPEDTPLVVPAPGVLINDDDPDDDPLTAALLTLPAHGTAVLEPDGALVYTPTQSWHGLDAFTYTASDGVLTATAVVTIDVGAVNHPPVAGGDVYTTGEDIVLAVPAPGVLANDMDADGDPLYALPAAPPAHGMLTLETDGSFLYTPAADWSGVDSFTYNVSDGVLTATAVVQIVVTPINDAPVAANDAYTVTSGSTLVVSAPGVLGNDADPEDDPLTAVLDAPPPTGAFALYPNGTLVYTPPPTLRGVVTAAYHASDGQADSNVATVTIRVTGCTIYLPMVWRNAAR